MAPIIYEINDEHSELVRNFLESREIPYKIKNLEKKLQNSDGNKENNLITQYFSISDQNGCFDVNHGSNECDEMKFYKIEYKKGNYQGKLFYVSGRLDGRAIEGIDHYLVPVCEIQNILGRKNANKIELIEPGEVYLSNNNWRINPNKKVKIKLIKRIEK